MIAVGHVHVYNGVLLAAGLLRMNDASRCFERLIVRFIACAFTVVMLPWFGIGNAHAHDYSKCMTNANGRGGDVFCHTIEEAYTSARNAAYAANKRWYEVPSWTSREPICHHLKPNAVYDSIWCEYRDGFGNNHVWHKSPVSSKCSLLGLSNPNTRQCGTPKCDSDCVLAGGNGSNPIDSATGNKKQVETDYVGGGIFPLRLERTYNSHRTTFDNAAVPLGVGWTHSYQARVVPLLSSGVVNGIRVYRPNGAIQTFTLSGGAWVGDADMPERLTAVISGTAISSANYTRADDTVESYDSSGNLTIITRKDGYQQTISYATVSGISPYVQKVTDPEGRSLVFTYTGNWLSSVTDPAGRVITYTYLNDDLTAVAYPNGGSGTATRLYHYNESGQTDGISQAHTLTGITDENSQRYASWGYDRRRRGTLSVHGDYASGTVDRTALTFNSDGTSTITDSLGKTRNYGFDVKYWVARLASLDAPCMNCANTAYAKTYDANGMPNATTDFAGNITDQDYNSRLLETQRTEAANDTQGRKRTIQTDWHATLRLPTERRTYDASNVLVSKTTWTYNARGQVLTTTQTDPATAATRTTTNIYCEQIDVDGGICPRVGLLLFVDSPRTDVTDLASYTYYPSDDASCAASPTTCPHRKGDLWKTTNALGHVTETLAYDGAGRPLSMKDANGIITELTYHPRGWLTSRTVKGAIPAEDRSTLIDYWPTGLIKRVTQADGSYTQYGYDAAQRLTGIADSAGNTIQYTLDNAGHRTAEATRDPGNTLTRTLSRVYNQLGQLQSQSDAYSHATAYAYDGNGNTTAVTDALGRVTGNVYDPLNRLAQTLQDVGGIGASTQFQYDAQDNLTRVTDPKGLHTDYAYNGLGDLTQLGSPDTGAIGYTYDSGGNRKTQTDARGVTATYGYDALNRLTGIAYPTASLDVGYQYDTVNAACASGETHAQGRLTGIADGSGLTQYCYNRFGELTRKVQVTGGQSFTTRYHYDAAGRLASQTYPDGAVLDAVRDGEGRITGLGITPNGGSRQVVLTGATYAPFGPSTGWTYGNGRSVLRSLNQNYQPQAIHDAGAGGLSLRFGFDAVGNLTQLEDAAQTSTLARYGYDTLNRLQQTQDGPTGTPIETYGYDATGNRTSVLKAGVTSTYAYPATSHRLSSVGGIARSYDAAGNTTGLGTGVGYAYSDAGRMELATQGAVVQATYGYNGKGEQVRRTQGTATAYYMYDEAGHLLGEYDGIGSPKQQLVWFGDLPVALLQGAGAGQTLHYIEPDHLGTPRVIVDGTRNVPIWKWSITGEAFGSTPPNQDPDGDGTAFVFDLRYPGQRYDSATGLNYNYFRDGYDPATGRYTQSDPIGLRGGISTYGYVYNQPTGAIDATGLQAFQTSIPGSPPAGSIYCVNGVVKPYFNFDKIPSYIQKCKATMDCLEAHELSHAADALRSNPTVCPSPPWYNLVGYPNMAVTFPNDPFPGRLFGELGVSELRAHTAELYCLMSKLKSMTGQCDEKCKSVVIKRIRDITGFFLPRIYDGTYWDL